MTYYQSYLLARLNGEPLPVDTKFHVADENECHANLTTLFPNEEDLDQWQNS